MIPGGKVGPEVVREGLKVFRTLEKLEFGPFECTEFPWGASHYLRTGLAMPEHGVNIMKEFDAIFFGAHGIPARVPDHVASQGLMHKLRKGLNLYINLHPIRLLPSIVSPIRDKSEIDFVVVRENSEGEYAVVGGRLHIHTPDELAIQATVVTRKGSERIMRFASELARKRNRKKRVSLATKSNALNYSMPLWDEIFEQVSTSYPDIETEEMHIDNFSMMLIKRPESFDVIAGTNQFGDILSDEGAIIAGGIGLAAGANLDLERRFPSLFEPIHGSAPDIASQGIANPVATILAAQMMLDWIGESQAAGLVKKAVEGVLVEGLVRTRDIHGTATTQEMGDAIVRMLYEVSRSN